MKKGKMKIEMKKQNIINKNFNNKKICLITLILLFFCILTPFMIKILILLKNNNPETTKIFMPCLLYEFTGLECAGCGTTRAMHQMLNLNFKEAFLLNPLIFIYVLFFIFFVIRYVILKLQRKNIKKFLKKEVKIILYIVLIITILFMILRNVIKFLI